MDEVILPCLPCRQGEKIREGVLVEPAAGHEECGNVVAGLLCGADKFGDGPLRYDVEADDADLEPRQRWVTSLQLCQGK